MLRTPLRVSCTGTSANAVISLEHKSKVNGRVSFPNCLERSSITGCKVALSLKDNSIWQEEVWCVPFSLVYVCSRTILAGSIRDLREVLPLFFFVLIFYSCSFKLLCKSKLKLTPKCVSIILPLTPVSSHGLFHV